MKKNSMENIRIPNKNKTITYNKTLLITINVKTSENVIWEEERGGEISVKDCPTESQRKLLCYCWCCFYCYCWCSFSFLAQTQLPCPPRRLPCLSCFISAPKRKVEERDAETRTKSSMERIQDEQKTLFLHILVSQGILL